MTKKDEEILLRMDDLMVEYTQQKKLAVRNSIIFAVYLLVLLLVFTSVIKSKIVNNFTPASIENAVSERMDVLQPLLPVYADTLINGIPEAYAKALANELQAKMPVIQANFIKETTKLTRDLKLVLESKLNEKLGKDFVLNQIRTFNGSGMNEIKVEESRDLVRAEMTNLINNVADKFQKLFRNDVNNLMTVVREFPRDKKATLSENRASKLLMHYLIALVDAEIMAAN
ncbi:hypothetical protein KJ708_12380 [bacterium]|nr:hypothetical protein [bacterium]MBU1917766.1 hypothetical protein [bacterium]